MSHPRDQVERLIAREYFKSKGDDSYKKIPVYERQILEMFERLDVPPPPGMLLRAKRMLINK